MKNSPQFVFKRITAKSTPPIFSTVKKGKINKTQEKLSTCTAGKSADDGIQLFGGKLPLLGNGSPNSSDLIHLQDAAPM